MLLFLFFCIGRAKLADALLYRRDELEPAPEAPAAAGSGVVERTDRLVAVCAQLEGETYMISHVSQLHAARPASASGDPT